MPRTGMILIHSRTVPGPLLNTLFIIMRCYPSRATGHRTNPQRDCTRLRMCDRNSNCMSIPNLEIAPLHACIFPVIKYCNLVIGCSFRPFIHFSITSGTGNTRDFVLGAKTYIRSVSSLFSKGASEDGRWLCGFSRYVASVLFWRRILRMASSH